MVLKVYMMCMFDEAAWLIAIGGWDKVFQGLSILVTSGIFEDVWWTFIWIEVFGIICA